MQVWGNTMQIWKPSDRCRTIGVLLFDEFSNHCLANAIEPLRAANTLSRKTLYRWQYLSIDGKKVTSSSGLPVQPEMPLSSHNGGDYLFVMPSYGFAKHANPATSRSLRAAMPRFTAMAGMDTGAWLMASAGLLDGRRATIHWDELTNLAETFPEIDVVEDRYVIDGDLITCGGVTTTFDLVLDLIQQQHGPMLRIEVAALFMHGQRSALRDPLLRESADQTIQAAVSLMRRKIELPLEIPEISRQLEIDQKKMESLFRTRLGSTPRDIYRAIRLREARRLAEHTRLSVAEIAARCGYTDASAMTRAFKAEFGHPPSSYRKLR